MRHKHCTFITLLNNCSRSTKLYDKNKCKTFLLQNAAEINIHEIFRGKIVPETQNSVVLRRFMIKIFQRNFYLLLICENLTVNWLQNEISYNEFLSCIELGFAVLRI